MKLYLDDERMCPTGWCQVKTVEAALDFLKTDLVDEISLDHDLGTEKTGYHVLLWIEERQNNLGIIPEKIYIHTANSSARIKMELTVKRINENRI